jgi:predicted nucleic acid-binding protein
MTGPIKVLFDLNIILDVLQKRLPYFVDSAQALALAESGAIEGYLAAHSWTTLFYLYARDQSADQARVRLTELLQFLTVAPVDQQVVEQALNLPYQDYEDAVQMMAAIRCGANYLVTRNVADFAAGPLSVLKPVELLSI